MLIYSPEHSMELREFGILIPIYDSRASKAFAHLLSHPVLGPRRAEWHLRHAGEPIGREDLLRAHSEGYVGRLFSAGLEEQIIRAFELRDSQGRPYRYEPASARRPLRELLADELYMVAGTYQCCLEALRGGFCYYFGGGTHHAHRDAGKGFCLLNDTVIALRKLQARGLARSAWVIDVDAHKGDGTAAITLGDPSIRTLSIHMAHGWPLDEPDVDEEGRPNPSYLPSDIDLPVDEGQEARYLPLLSSGLGRLEVLSRPELAVVVDGADPYELDELPSTAPLRLTLSQLLERDLLIYRFLRERRIPSAWLMSGGYGERSWEVYAQFLGKVLPERLEKGSTAA
jgi:acetoin utilization deacetylase AcuC-like enzyme